MTAERRRSSRWRRLGVKLILLALAAPVLAVVAGDLWLCSPWGRNWIGTKISHRLGLTVKIGPSLWTPWSGFVVHGIEVRAPDSLGDSFEWPILKTGDIEVDPNWISSLRGSPAIESVCVNDPDLTLTPGLLLALSAARKAAEPPEVADAGPQSMPESFMPVQPPPATLATADPEPPSVAVPALPVAPVTELSPAQLPPVAIAPPVLEILPVGPRISPANPPQAAPAAETSKAGGVPPPVVAAPVPAPDPTAIMPASQVDARPPLVLEVRRGRFRMLGSQGQEPVTEINDISVRLPVQGNDADGSISVGSVRLADHPLVEKLAFSMKWRSPEIQIEQQHFTFAGADLEVSLRLARLPGLPFVMETRVPVQALPLWDGPLGRKLSARQVEGVVRIAGAVPAPSSWQGGGFARFEDLRVEGEERTLRFTRGDGAVFLGDGSVRCPETRLIGEDFALLGNGHAGPDHLANAGVFRWVAHSDVIASWVQKIQSIDPGLKVQVQQMETPERAMVDFSWVASGESPGIELGGGGSVVSPAVFVSFLGH